MTRAQLALDERADQMHAESEKLEDADRFELAIRVAEQGLRIRRQVWGNNHPETAITMRGLADLYREVKQFEKARTLYFQSLRILQELPNHLEHPSLTLSLRAMDRFYRDIRADVRDDDRETFLRTEMDLATKAGVSSIISTLRRNLARHFIDRGRVQEAGDILMELIGKEPALVYVLSAIKALVEHQREKGQFEASDATINRTIELARLAYAKWHDWSNLSSLVRFYRDLGVESELQTLLEAALVETDESYYGWVRRDLARLYGLSREVRQGSKSC